MIMDFGSICLSSFCNRAVLFGLAPSKCGRRTMGTLLILTCPATSKTIQASSVIASATNRHCQFRLPMNRPYYPLLSLRGNPKQSLAHPDCPPDLGWPVETGRAHDRNLSGLAMTLAVII